MDHVDIVIVGVDLGVGGMQFTYMRKLLLDYLNHIGDIGI